MPPVWCLHVRKEFMLIVSYLEGRALHSPCLSVSVPQSQASSPGYQDQLSPLQLILHRLSSQVSNITPDPDVNSIFALLSQRNNCLSCYMWYIFCLHCIHAAHSWCPSVCHAQPSLMLSNLLTLSCFSSNHLVSILQFFFLILFPSCGYSCSSRCPLSPRHTLWLP